MTIIDAHSHLWLRQDTRVDGKRILSLKNGRSIFMDEEVQMLPPFMIDGVNSAEVFLSNMDYAQVAGAVVVQEADRRLSERLPDRGTTPLSRPFLLHGNGWDAEQAQTVIDAGLKGIAVPGHRLHEPLQTHRIIFILTAKFLILLVFGFLSL